MTQPQQLAQITPAKAPLTINQPSVPPPSPWPRRLKRFFLWLSRALWAAKPTFFELGLFSFSALLTAVGFFVEAVPFFIAFLPFLFAILCNSKKVKFWNVAAYFTWVAMISTWGLIQLGHDPLYVIPTTFLAVVLVSGITAWGTVGLTALMFSAIPFFPGSPLLIVGSIMPDLDIWSLLPLTFALILIEKHPMLAIRVSLIIAVISLPRVINLGISWNAFVPHSPTVSVEPTIPPQPIAISDIQAITRTGYWDAIASRIPAGTTAILGENIIKHTERDGWSYWCRTAKQKGATLYIGVQGEDAVGEVWKFTGATCPTPERIYQAQIGVPGVTGGWVPNITDWQTWSQPNPDPQWLISFEAFSLLRWAGVGFSGASHAIVISNDKWTEPLPVGLLRRKVGREFEKLFGIKTVYAETDKNFVVILP